MIIKNTEHQKEKLDYVLLTDSAEEPVTLEEVKTHLRIDGSDYDSLLTPLITTARRIGEKITGRDFVNKTWKGYLDNFPYYCDKGIIIRKSKLQSITSIQYYLDGSLTTFDSSNYYLTDNSDYSGIYLNSTSSYPTNVDDRKQAIIITFVSGYGPSASDVPQGIKQAILAHITYLYENSGDCVSDNAKSLFQSLYYPYIIADLLFDVI